MRPKSGSKPKIAGGANTVTQKELFGTEFQEVLRQLAVAPAIGQRYRRARGKVIQRVLMPKTRCHVYYFHDLNRDLVEIHSIWGARRGRGPSL